MITSDMTKTALVIVCFIPVLMMVACAGTNQLAASMVYEAKAQIEAAKQMGAERLAAEELSEAVKLLLEAETALLAHNEPEAYRIGVKTHLMARYAEVVAVRNSAEKNAAIAELELETTRQDVEKARTESESAERELEELSNH